MNGRGGRCWLEVEQVVVLLLNMILAPASEVVVFGMSCLSENKENEMRR